MPYILMNTSVKITSLGALASALGITIGYWLYRISKRNSTNPLRIKDYQEGVVYLIQFGRTSAVPSISAYCLKLETWLRIYDIPYRTIASNLSQTPGGTLPYVELDGVQYPDSDLAIQDITNKLGKEELIEASLKHLSSGDRAALVGIESLAQERVFYANFLMRLPYAKELMQLFRPETFNWLTLRIAASQWANIVYQKCRSNGIGRHSIENINRIAEADLMALSDFLGVKHFFAGFKATKVDATVFGVLALILYLPFDIHQRKFMQNKCPNLCEFCERMKKRYWPDWERVTLNNSMNSNWKPRV